MENAIRLAAPFPPVPAAVSTEASLAVSLNFTYVLGGLRAFGVP